MKKSQISKEPELLQRLGFRANLATDEELINKLQQWHLKYWFLFSKYIIVFLFLCWDL